MSSSNAGLIVSIYFGYHDSNVTIANHERILLHLEAERMLGEKHAKATAEQMNKVLDSALEYAGATSDDIGEVLIARWIAQYDLSMPIRIGLRCFTPVITGHHANHIGTAMPSGFEQCLVLCADGGSEDGASSMYLYDHGRLDRIALLDNTFVTGRIYGTAAQMTVQPDFMKAHASDTGKMMGLAAYGKYHGELAKRVWEILPVVNQMHPEGVHHLCRHFGLSDVYERMPDQPRRDFAATVQQEWEDELLRVTANFRHLSPRLVIVGGCAMNVVANGRLANAGIFDEIFIPAMPGDAGQSVGAIWFRHRHLATTTPFLGRHFGIEVTSASVPAIVDDLCAGKVVAVYSGASESGPRALGNRSILALPSSEDVRVRVSEEIKGREPYRPVAPIIREEDLTRFYEAKQPSPYMSYAYKAKDEVAAGAPAIVHVDGTSRVQTVTATQQPLMYDVLTALAHRGVLPIVANTSMNVAGKPMVDTPQDARTFLATTPVDVLYLGDQRLERL